MLIASPNLPRLNLDGNSGSPRILFSATQLIEIKYDVYMAATPREMTCMNATLEPRLIRDSNRTKVMVTYTEWRGTPSLGDTCHVLVLADGPTYYLVTTWSNSLD